MIFYIQMNDNSTHFLNLMAAYIARKKNNENTIKNYTFQNRKLN
jgi:hypothetical protein